MARTASVAIAGYYPTKRELIPRIASILAPHTGEQEVVFLDPCAGEGEAVLALIKLLCKHTHPTLYACEMEAARFEALKNAAKEQGWQLANNLLHGDAFKVTYELKNKEGVSVLYLNPPYDTDRQHGRLEQKFLQRFTPTLMMGGALLFVVPYYALKASAQYLATEYESLHCYRFPEEDFKDFKQVVLFAKKCDTRLQPDPEIQSRVERWAASVNGLPELPNLMSAPVADVVTSKKYCEGLEEWVLRPTDVSALLQKVKPWTQTTRGGVMQAVRGILPEVPVNELLLRRYPVATPPRPAHIAAGIASGIFNGSRVSPTNPKSKLPDLLVKGVFSQEYRTVEEKQSKDGSTTSYVQIQQPKLVATVLDLSTYQYHTLGSDSNTNPDIKSLTVAGLLKHYGDSMMDLMRQQCPVLYDPRRDADSIPLARTARKPFVAQGDAAKALVSLLGGPGIPINHRRGRGAILLGEIGSGKSTVSLVVSETIQSKRPLIVCPPHLLTGWTNEIAAVLPDAKVQILSSIQDVENVARDTSDQTIVSVLSREMAKLSHGWAGVQDSCPKCGGATPMVAEELARKRSRCEVRPLIGSGLLADTALTLANLLQPFAPRDEVISMLLASRWARRRADFYAARINPEVVAATQIDSKQFPGLPIDYLDNVLDALVTLDLAESDKDLRRAIVWGLMAIDDQALIERVALRYCASTYWHAEQFGRDLLLMLAPNGERQCRVVGQFQKEVGRYESDHWGNVFRNATAALQGENHIKIADLPLSWKGGTLTVSQATGGSLLAARSALKYITRCSNLKWGQECGGFLFHAVPEPRRAALASHIQHHYPRLFDLFILDEAHEYATEGSAQQKASHRLAGLGAPVIAMTGSVMNGYAESLFMLMWAVGREFRKQFSRTDKQRFIDRFGYRKRLVVENNDGLPTKPAEYGALSDRVSRSERVIGNAPGVLPLFLLQHLLPISVTLHKTDLALDLPPCTQERHLVEPTPELLQRFKRLQSALVAQIKKDQFKEGLAGKLFGQLAELPSYLDRATQDTGNSDHGDYEICYPESVGGAIVASQEAFPASELQPKELWMLERIKQELAEGRNVMVFSWHLSLLPRLARMIELATGETVPVLYAAKVPTAKRQDWITKQVVKKGARVMVTNPVAIQTGLNNLVHFSTEIWMENPACNPITYRQAGGRVDRIGAGKPTRLLFPIYAGTLQEQLHELLMQKVAVSTATDGLDPESALLASGVGPNEFMLGLSIGKQLWAMLSNDTPDSRIYATI